MLHHYTDEELVRQYNQQRHDLLFSALYRRYVTKVYRKCLSFTKDSDLAHDHTQEVFLRVLQNMQHFQERAQFGTWLYQITNNYCVDQLRRNRRFAPEEFSEPVEQVPSLPDEGELLEDRCQRLERILTELPEAEADLFLKKYYEGMDIAALSQQMGLKPSAVKMRLKRTRDRVRERMLMAA